MIGKALAAIARSGMAFRQGCFFSTKLPLRPVESEEEDSLELMDWRAMIEAERRNVMKNYDTLLPGVFVRNDMLIDE